MPFTVVVDEAQSLLSGSLSSMLAEGRKFGLSVVLAHQYLDQLDDELRPAIDGNVATTIAFRSAARDAGTLKMRFGGSVDETTLTTLPDLTAVVMRSSAHAALPHTLIVDHNERVPRRDAAELAQVETRLRKRTETDLVDRFRGATSPAAQGISRVTTDRAAQVAGTPAHRQQSSFLDEWLAKRDKRDEVPSSEQPVDDTACLEEESE